MRNVIGLDYRTLRDTACVRRPACFADVNDNIGICTIRCVLHQWGFFEREAKRYVYLGKCTPEEVNDNIGVCTARQFSDLLAVVVFFLPCGVCPFLSELLNTDKRRGELRTRASVVGSRRQKPDDCTRGNIHNEACRTQRRHIDCRIGGLCTIIDASVGEGQKKSRVSGLPIMVICKRQEEDETEAKQRVYAQYDNNEGGKKSISVNVILMVSHSCQWNRFLLIWNCLFQEETFRVYN